MILRKPSRRTRRALGDARCELEDGVTRACGELLKKNYRWSIPGLALTLLLLGGPGLLVAWSRGNILDFIVIELGLTAWTALTYFHIGKNLSTLREGFLHRQGKMILRGIWLSVISVVLLGGEVFGMALISVGGTTDLFPFLIVLALLINLTFYRLMKTYTPEGREIMDRLRGFRMYMKTAEKERIRALAATSMPDDTPERFERLLPWALALGVERQWASRFEELLQAAGYNPGWYSGTAPWHLAGTNHMTGSLSSDLGQAISSAAGPPGSSSGADGGSSGGGGGGGGGGGW